MAAKKKTTKKPTSRKQAPLKKASRKPAGGGKTAAKKAAQKMSGVDAAAKVLSERKQPLRCREMIEQMAANSYWTSPGGQTPSATIYSSILREIQKKGKDARFRKVERGRFELNR